MKRKIIIAFSVCSLIFILSGLFIITTIEKSTAKLDILIRLHRVEILREQLLIRIKRAQSDLNLWNTRHARSMDAVVTDVRTMDSALDACFNCHHGESVMRRLTNLRNQNEQYKNALSRVFTLRANRSRMRAEENVAFMAGADLIAEVGAITNMTDRNLQERTRSTLKEIARTKTVIFLLLAAVPLIALGLFGVFLRGFTKPVGALLIATRRLKAGELSYRIEGLKDEFGEVAASFNDMAFTLREHYMKMQWAEQAIVLGEMAGGLAHEINNPLAGIKAAMEVLSGDPTVSEENKNLPSQVIEQVRRIEVLLKSLLNFARPPKPQFMSVDLNEVLDAAISLAKKHPLFLSNSSLSIKIVQDFAARLPQTKADPFQLQQVFLNLLLNAADAMPAGGAITVRTSYSARSPLLSISILDTGKGLGGDVIDKIFLPFFTTKPKGTGLGLALAKRLVEQHGGGILAVNNPAGGASFVVTLPLLEGDGGTGT